MRGLRGCEGVGGGGGAEMGGEYIARVGEGGGEGVEEERVDPGGLAL